jgi:hypothetical protein
MKRAGRAAHRRTPKQRQITPSFVIVATISCTNCSMISGIVL